MSTHPCVTTTISTIAATLVYAIVKYVLNQSIELLDIVVFAAIFGVIFYFAQTYFGKKVKKK